MGPPFWAFLKYLEVFWALFLSSGKFMSLSQFLLTHSLTMTALQRYLPIHCKVALHWKWKTNYKHVQGIFYNPEDCGSYVTCNSDNEGGIRVSKIASRYIQYWSNKFDWYKGTYLGTYIKYQSTNSPKLTRILISRQLRWTALLTFSSMMSSRFPTFK